MRWCCGYLWQRCNQYNGIATQLAAISLRCSMNGSLHSFQLELQWWCGDLCQRCYQYIGTATHLWCSMYEPLLWCLMDVFFFLPSCPHRSQYKWYISSKIVFPYFCLTFFFFSCMPRRMGWSWWFLYEGYDWASDIQWRRDDVSGK